MYTSATIYTHDNRKLLNNILTWLTGIGDYSVPVELSRFGAD